MAFALRVFLASFFIVLAGAALNVRSTRGRVTGTAVTTRAEETFQDYVAAHGRDYALGSAEYEQRRSIFAKRLAAIAAHNGQTTRLWTASVNGLTDRTEEELAMLRGWRHVKGPRAAKTGFGFLAMGVGVQQTFSPPEEVDWRNLTMALRVPNQGSCGSCWAVASASMLEGRHEAQTGNTDRTFSAQQFVDCVPNPRECGGSGGCNGATVELAMQYAELMGGVEDQLTVPYTGFDQRCDQPVPSSSKSLFLSQVPTRIATKGAASDGMFRHWETLPQNKAEPLMRALVDGPVAVAAAAGYWHLYGGGIFDSCKKDAIVDHAVVAFGYGKEEGRKFWLIRNSWGDAWGESGFIRLLRQATPKEEEEWCGTDNDPAQGLACKPYPDAVKVCGMCGILYDSVAVDFRPETSGSQHVSSP